MAAITFPKLIQSLKAGQYKPIYFLYGDEPYFIDMVSDFMENNILSESEKSFNFQVIYGKDTDAVSIRNACSRYPLMSKYQLIIIKEAQNLTGLSELESYISKPIESTILVFCYKYKKPDKRLKIFKLIDEHGVMFESKKIAENKLQAWVQEYLAEKQYKITPKAAFLVCEYIGNHLENLVNALEKMILNLEAGAMISEADVEKHVGISRDYNVFELINAMSNRDLAKITRIANYISNHPKEIPFPVLVVTLFGYFSKLAAIVYGQKADRETLLSYGIMDWLQKDYIKAAKIYGKSIKRILMLLEEFDLRYKGVNDVGTPESELVKELLFKIVLQ